MRLSEAPALQRLDNAYHLPFLTACAAAMSAQGSVTEIEAEHLRILLKDRHRQQPEAESLIQKLQAEKNAAFEVLVTRLGSQRFESLLLRWTAAKALESFNFAVWGLAQELLHKADLMFNQPFHIYSGRSCLRRTPFSAFLIEAASHLHSLADDLHDSVNDLRRWPLPPGNTLEESLIQHLGFTQTEENGFDTWDLHRLLGDVWNGLELYADFQGQFLEQLSQNLELESDEARLRYLLEDLKMLLQGSRQSTRLDASPLDVLESRRLRTLSVLQESKDMAIELHERIVASLKTSRIGASNHNVWTENEGRAIINHLLDRGITPTAAREAVAALVRYCEAHNVSPEQLLEAELHKIHPSLDQSAAVILKKASHTDRMSASFSDEKALVIHKKDVLMQAIGARLISLSAILFALLLPGCGVKTMPRSDVLDLRPSVPYHAEQRRTPPKNQEPAKPENAEPAAPPSKAEVP